MIALTESERNYYYDNRMYMTYIGNKDGADIYRDHYTGQYCKLKLTHYLKS